MVLSGVKCGISFKALVFSLCKHEVSGECTFKKILVQIQYSTIYHENKTYKLV